MTVRIIQPIVPEYRKALFDGLCDVYDWRVEVWAAETLGNDCSVTLDKAVYDYSHDFVRFWRLLWQRGISLKGLSKGDVVVVCGDMHQISSLLIAAQAKLFGIGVVWWGHHATATSSRISTSIRLFFAKLLSDVMLVYTRTGVDYLKHKGFCGDAVFATGNTIDQRPIKAAISQYHGEDMFDGKSGILCCSVLRKKVRLDVVIRAITDKRLANVKLAVIGDGPMLQEYKQIARENGVQDRVIWLGTIRDQFAMAPWFLSAKAFVYPGSIGLSLLHSMSYGLPVVVHDNPAHQMPEYEIMEDEKTGLCFKEDDVVDLSDKLAALITDEGMRERMSEYCKKQAYERYSMEQMVVNFADAIKGALKRRS